MRAGGTNGYGSRSGGRAIYRFRERPISEILALPGSPAGRSRLAAAAWAVLVAVLLWTPGPEAPPRWQWLAAFGAAGGDKLVHALLFAVLAWFLCGSRRGGPAAGWLAGCFVLAVAYGGLTEAVQALVVGRDPSLGDLAADALGAAAGVLAFARRPGGRPLVR
ncbi:MAG TPA: VanZ family protein [Thermoanaerobaculia bacterium]|nr:VanZ family protein [Thermoanaerobaculia bacterium]